MRELSLEYLNLDPFSMIGKDWCLITAGTQEKWNTMTASWGFMGVMWNKNCIMATVRPNRYTHEFLKNNELFTVSFFENEYRKALAFCGSHSGRDCDKAKETGLVPLFTDNTVTFEQAKIVFVCRKIFTMDMDPDCLDTELNKQYNSDPIHTEFIGEILKVLAK